MVAFIIWAAVGILFIGEGIYCFMTKKEMPFGFWANAKVLPIKDVKGYNRALGKLWCVFGIVFILLGIPLLAGQNSPFIIFSILGAMAECIIAMGVYTVGIEGKYRKKP